MQRIKQYYFQSFIIHHSSFSLISSWQT